MNSGSCSQMSSSWKWPITIQRREDNENVAQKVQRMERDSS